MRNYLFYFFNWICPLVMSFSFDVACRLTSEEEKVKSVSFQFSVFSLRPFPSFTCFFLSTFNVRPSKFNFKISPSSLFWIRNKWTFLQKCWIYITGATFIIPTLMGSWSSARIAIARKICSTQFYYCSTPFEQ